MAEPKDPACDERPDEGSDELMEDGQEEVFSRTAVEHGLIRDPPAIGPEHYDEEADGAGRWNSGGREVPEYQRLARR